jgi:hypothetical protein
MHKFLPIATIEKFVPRMDRLSVSEVARSPQGFLTAYRKAGGRSNRLDSYWKQKREAFIARHVAQLDQRGEPYYDRTGLPTRRHLALIAWAYSPAASLNVFTKRYRERT